MTDNQRALKTIDLFIDSNMARIRSAFKEAATQLFTRVVDNTPVYFLHEPTSGNTKANWNFSVGTPDVSYSPSISDIRGDATRSAIRAGIQSTKIDDFTVLCLANSAPAISYLELGLYPNPPVAGSWNRLTKQFEIRSSGGYSLQAPQGVAGVIAMQWPSIVSDAVANAVFKHSNR